MLGRQTSLRNTGQETSRARHQAQCDVTLASVISGEDGRMVLWATRIALITPHYTYRLLNVLINKVKKAQGEHHVLCDEAVIWRRESALPGMKERHAAVQNAVCAVERVVDKALIDGIAEICKAAAPKNCFAPKSKIIPVVHRDTKAAHRFLLFIL